MKLLTLNHLSDFRLIALLPVGCTTRTGRFQLFIILNRFSITFDHENGRSDRTENPYRSEFVGPNFGPNLNMSLNMSAVRILVRKSQSDFLNSGPAFLNLFENPDQEPDCTNSVQPSRITKVEPGFGPWIPGSNIIEFDDMHV